MALQSLKSVTSYYRGLFYFQRGGRLKDCTLGGSTAQQVHLYSLSKTLQLWDAAHYRDVNFYTDIRKNLSNVGIPATGMPLSIFCHCKATAYLFLLLVYPIAAACAALYCKVRYGAPFAAGFEQQLLDPQHWFAIWRLNCLVVAWHSYLSQSPEYSMEDKGSFLLEGDKAGIPVSPFLKLGSLVVKHKSIEGGMGLHFFENFAQGGDWILQERMTNSKFIASLLPEDAPLSTLRVITGSRCWLMQQGSSGQQAAAGGVEVMTVVFRAGLAGASTDHTSICFDVDRTSGVIGQGISNQHWYKLGLQHVGRVDASASTTYTHHPDTGKAIAGQPIPDFKEMLQLVCDSHVRLVPDVPLVGWDVALTPQGVSLLEINISCNFFNGSYDRQGYTAFVRDYLVALEQQEEPVGVKNKFKQT